MMDDVMLMMMMMMLMCQQQQPMMVSLPPAGSTWRDSLPDNCYIGNYSFI